MRRQPFESKLSDSIWDLLWFDSKKSFQPILLLLFQTGASSAKVWVSNVGSCPTENPLLCPQIFNVHWAITRGWHGHLVKQTTWTVPFSISFNQNLSSRSDVEYFSCSQVCHWWFPLPCFQFAKLMTSLFAPTSFYVTLIS